MSTAFWIQTNNLDPEQRQAVENISEEKSFMLKGAAGSGKTNILLLRAKWLTLKSISNFKIIVFTKSLRTFVEEGCALYKINPSAVVTQMSFFRDILGEYGVSVELTGGFEEDRGLLSGKVLSLINAGKIPNTYCSALLVDEAQDYTDTELLVFRGLTSRLVLASDLRQSIYKTTHTPGLPEKLVGGEVVTLKYHYRSGLKLCKVADGILTDTATYPRVQNECKYPEAAMPSSVVAKTCESFEQQIELILTNLSDQIALYPDEKIGVLFPKKEQAVAFSAAMNGSAMASAASQVWVDTLHGSKGWEFRAVHLAGLEVLNRMGPVQKRLAYVGVLRGKTSVHIYYTAHIPGYLDSALATLAPPAPNPTFDSLFGN